MVSRKKVLVAMSGGVDSAVAAGVLKDEGYDVVGVHMALLRNRDFSNQLSRGCCSLDDAQDAKEVCSILDIPFYVWDLSEGFRDKVVKDFLAEYKIGHTPNPCIRCNQFIKFRILYTKAMELGFDLIATGHYANTVAPEIVVATQPEIATASPRNDKDGLFRGENFPKDQSYVLAAMGPEILSKVIFPLGKFHTKTAVREKAKEYGFPLHSKPDSTDICFIERGKTREFLQAHLGTKPGEIQDLEGNILGNHNGAYLYTIGQREGLNLGNPDPSGKPRYVVKTDVVNNIVTVGLKQDLATTRFQIKNLQQFTPYNWSDTKVQVRAHGDEYQVTDFHNDTITVATPIMGLAKGQSCVGYIGDQVVFESTID
jgi:tRNA-specific 2-thiouridylase